MSDSALQHRLLLALAWLLTLVVAPNRRLPDVWTLLTGAEANPHVYEDAKRWGERLVTKGDLSGAKPSGRPPGKTLITRAEAKAAADDVKKGDENGKRFSSLKAAAASSPSMQRVVAVLGEHEIRKDGTILKAINDLTGANLHFGKETVKKLLSADDKERRLAAAHTFQDLFVKDHSFLRRIVQIDSKKLWVSTCLSGRHVLLHGEDVEVEQDARLTKKKCAINYYLAVTADAGVVALKYVTGTTGLKRQFKVGYYSTLDACTA